MAEAFFAVDLRVEGVLLARGRFSYPREDELYGELAARATAWFQKDFSAYARQVYAEDESPHKRFRFPRFEYSFSVQDKEGTSLLSVTLSREGNILSHYEERLFHRHGLLAPPERHKPRSIKH